MPQEKIKELQQRIKENPADNEAIESYAIALSDIGENEEALKHFIFLKNKFPNLRMVNNNDLKTIKNVAFCAGSGSEFIESTSAEAFVTGDLKYHTAVETNKVVFDIGHFESEILVLQEFKKLLGIEVEFSNEKSPFIV